MANRSWAAEAGLFFAISVLFFVSITAFDPFVSSYAAELGVGPALIGSMVGVTGLASMFARLPLGILSGMLSRRKLFIQAGFALTIVCWTAAFLAPGAGTLFLGKLSNGLAGSTWVIFTVMFPSLFPDRDGAKAMAFISAASPLGSLAGSTIGGLVIHAYGYSAGFSVAVLAALLALALTFFLKEGQPPARTGEPTFTRRTLTSQLSDKRLWAISLLGALIQMTMYGTRDTFTPLMAQQLGAGPIAVSWLANTHLMMFGLSTALCPWLYRRLGLVRTGVLGFAAQGLAIVLMPAAGGLPALFALQAAAGIAYGMAFTFLMSIVLERTRPHEKTTRMGFFQSLYSLGMFVGPLLLGLLVDGVSEAAGFAVWGALSAIGAALAGALYRRGAAPVAINAEEPRI
ncbi:MFS transporter [Cohnella massiliensis]|uniref:MFS transporter n=1 Tax=Cohnella massiliensis TaxID=1816691 RepID=UPI0009BA83F2|nr:MFS transporter [Cohnella massiliensis]